MANIGVHHCSPTNSTYFTNCCKVAICSDQDSCPRCHKKVIPVKDRWECAFGQERERMKRAVTLRYKEMGYQQSAMVAAKLLGKDYTPPHLCLMCGKPEAECYC